MKICDAKLRAVIGAMTNAIGYTQGNTFLNSIPEIDSDYQEQLIAPHFLETTALGEFTTIGSGYVLPSFGRAAVRVKGGETIHVPEFDFRATEKGRLSGWPRGEDTISEVQRKGIAQRMLREISGLLWNAQNKTTVDLFNRAVTEENGIWEWDRSKKEILTRLNDGWKILLPCAQHSALSYELRMRGLLRYEPSPHVEGNMGFLCGPKEKLGVWRRTSDDVPAFAWLNGQEFTVNLTSFLLRGMAIINSNMIIGVELGECPEVD
jgi:hypothetical protein